MVMMYDSYSCRPTASKVDVERIKSSVRDYGEKVIIV